MTPVTEAKYHDGFHLRVTAEEIRSNFQKRLDNHTTALRLLNESKLVLVGAKGGKSDMIKLHEHQIRLITFIIGHISPDDAFALTMNEVDQLMLLRDITDLGLEDSK